MSANQENVQSELDRMRATEEAARQMTGGLAKTIKIVLPIAWLMPIIPILGFFLLGFGAIVCAILSVMISAKGAKSRGVKYFLISVLGSGAVGIVWVIIYGTVVAMFG